MTAQFCAQKDEYTVYSYDYARSEKKGHVWRQHGVSDNLEELLLESDSEMLATKAEYARRPEILLLDQAITEYRGNLDADY